MSDFGESIDNSETIITNKHFFYVFLDYLIRIGPFPLPYFPLFIFICIIIILEIDLLNGLDSFIYSFLQLIRKHSIGFILFFLYSLSHMSWRVYYMKERFKCGDPNPDLAPPDFEINFMIISAVLLTLYTVLFLCLNEYWFNNDLKDTRK